MHHDSPSFRSWLQSFTRAQISGALGTVADYAILFVLTEVFHAWYVVATALGALSGAVTNFFLNRSWAFQAVHGHLGKQARRYAWVAAGSLALNTGGVYIITEYFRLHYAFSVILVGLLVGFFFNFPLHRRFVYH